MAHIYMALQRSRQIDSSCSSRDEALFNCVLVLFALPASHSLNRVFFLSFQKPGRWTPGRAATPGCNSKTAHLHTSRLAELRGFSSAVQNACPPRPGSVSSPVVVLMKRFITCWRGTKQFFVWRPSALFPVLLPRWAETAQLRFEPVSDGRFLPSAGVYGDGTPATARSR